MQKSILGIYEPGIIELITGCMGSGKTEEFQRRFSKLDYSIIPYLTFQPSINDRDEENTIASRNGAIMSAIKIKDPYHIYDYISQSEKNILVVGLEETQFFPKSIEEVVLNLVIKKNMNVIISGLDMDSEGNSFGSMDYFLKLAHKIHKPEAVCQDCKETLAKFSYRLEKKEQQILIGKDNYLALCIKCYDTRKNP
jgi:thymidine kinase